MGPAQIELIVALFEQGSLSAAAKQLGRSQPAVTKALKKIEVSIGAPLFFRTSYGVVPTEVGRAAVERCRKIHDDLRRLDEDLHQIAGDLVGEVSVVVSPVAALKIIPSVASRFRKRFPGVRLSIIAGHAPEAYGFLRSGAADFVIGPPPEAGTSAGLQIQNLFTCPLTFATGAGSRHLINPTPKSLSEGHWIKIGLVNRRPVYAEYFEANGLPEPAPVATSNSILSVLSMVRDSDLLVSVPTPVFAEIGQQWSLKEVKVAGPMPMIPVALTSSTEQIQTRAAMVFADLVTELSQNVMTEV